MMAGGDDKAMEREGTRYRVRAHGRAALVGEDELVIGRSPYCSLVLDQDTLSRLHATLKIAGEEVELADLGSSNGTFLNGERITGTVRVKPSDDIRLGTVRIWIEIASARPSLETGRLPTVNPPTTPVEDTLVKKTPRGEPQP
jgi:pSer/pThr/pTyr-binding forkhead associated (FHA) protein